MLLVDIDQAVGWRSTLINSRRLSMLSTWLTPIFTALFITPSFYSVLLNNISVHDIKTPPLNIFFLNFFIIVPFIKISYWNGIPSFIQKELFTNKSHKFFYPEELFVQLVGQVVCNVNVRKHRVTLLRYIMYRSLPSTEVTVSIGLKNVFRVGTSIP